MPGIPDGDRPGLTDQEQAESAAKYEMSIFDEDLDLQRRALSGLEFPLDVAAELHTRADRVSVSSAASSPPRSANEEPRWPRRVRAGPRKRM